MKYVSYMICTGLICLSAGCGPEVLVADYLFNRRCPPYVSIKVGATPLHWAAAYGSVEDVEYLMSQGESVNLRTGNGKGRTPLHFAAWKGNYPTAELLIHQGADVNAKVQSGETPLFYASGMESENWDDWPNEFRPALSEDHTAVAKLLIGHGADVNVKEERGGRTALVVAIKSNAPDIVKLLFDHGAELPSNSDYILWQTIKISPDIAEVLIRNGAKVNVDKRNAESIPIIAAVECENIEITRLLLEHGADVNARNGMGSTPLMLAAMRGNLVLVKLLVEHGANVDAVNKNGDTAYECAKKGRNMISRQVREGCEAVMRYLGR